MTRHADLNTPARTLLGPGPSMVPPRVMRAMLQPVVGHLDPTYLAVMDDVKDLLRYVFQTQNDLTIALPGTGSAGMEAGICNFVEPGDSVVICVNGYFSERMFDMAGRYGAEVCRVERPWGEGFTPADIEAALRQKRAKLVAIVHGETSTGTVQPLEGIAEVVHRYGGLLLVDCVCSLGGVPIKVDDLDIDIAYSGSQKCLSCPPGLAPITVGQRARDVLRQRKTKVANWYLDLGMLEAYWGSPRVYHHTGPISMTYAMREALRLVEEEGLEARWERHAANARELWQGLGAIGLHPIVPIDRRLASLTTVAAPYGVDEAVIRRRLLDDYNIEIAGGLGAYKGKAWRVGLMGHSSHRENIVVLLGALERLLR